MAIAVIFLLLPVFIYLVLVIVPIGPVWLITTIIVTALLAYIWLGYVLAWGPLWTGDPRADAYTVAAANLYTFAAVIGGLTATVGRKLTVRVGFLTYPLVTVSVLILAFLPLFIILGV